MVNNREMRYTTKLRCTKYTQGVQHPNWWREGEAAAGLAAQSGADGDGVDNNTGVNEAKYTLKCRKKVALRFYSSV